LPAPTGIGGHGEASDCALELLVDLGWKTLATALAILLSLSSASVAMTSR
jgi:hypothetical protein